MIRNKIEMAPIINIRKEEEDVTTDVALIFLKKTAMNKCKPMYLNMWINFLNRTIR